MKLSLELRKRNEQIIQKLKAVKKINVNLRRPRTPRIPHIAIPKVDIPDFNISMPSASPELYDIKLTDDYNPKTVSDAFDIAWERTDKFSTWYNIYEQEALVRACIDTLAYFATCKGYFVTTDNPIKQEALDEINMMNYKINIETSMGIGVRRMYIYGVSPFEKARNKKGNIRKLIPLDPAKLEPTIGKKHNIEKYVYNSNIELKPEDVLLLVNNPLEKPYEGFSKIHPIENAVLLKRHLEHDIKEAALRLWAPAAHIQLDTTGLTPTQERLAIQKFINNLIPGKSLVTNKSVDYSKIDVRPDMVALVKTWEATNEEIIGNFGVPKALLAREKTMNRATLEYSIKAMYEGVIRGLQTYLGREIESQLYQDVLERYGVKDEIVTHNWKPFEKEDLARLANAVCALYEDEIIDKFKSWELLALGSYSPHKIKEADDKKYEESDSIREVIK